MKAEVTVKVTTTYTTEIDVSLYSDDDSAEAQAEWLMLIQNDEGALYRLAKSECTGFEDVKSNIKVIK